MNPDLITHRLAFAIRVDDHFSARPVDEPLVVALDSRAPGVGAEDGGQRHPDGTYRWRELPDGPYVVTVTSPSGRWVRWDAAPIAVAVPLADRGHAVAVEMWPLPVATPEPGIAAVRARLVGSGVAGLRVEIDGHATATPSGRWTRADAQGELLFPLPGGPWPLTDDGRLDLEVRVPGRLVAAVEIVPAAPLPGARFSLPADRVSRVRIHVT